MEDEALEARKRKRLERDPLHQGLIVARANLKARDYQIDLAAKLNKTQVGAAETGRGCHRVSPCLEIWICQPSLPPPPHADGVGGHAAEPAGRLLLQRVRLHPAGQQVVPGPH